MAPAIAELEKPGWKKCVHLGCAPKACGVYAERPDTCRTFQCGWLTSPELPSRFRPDRCGFAVVGRADGLEVWELDGKEFAGSRLHKFLDLRHEAQITVVRPE